MTRFKILFLFCFIWSSSFCQQMDWMIDPSYNGLNWPAFVNKVEQNHPIQFFYKEADVASFQAPQLTKEILLLEFLQTQLPDCNIAHDQQGHIFISKGVEIATQLSKDIYPEVVIKNNKKDSIPVQNKDFASTTNQHIAKVIVIGDPRKGAGKSKAVLNGVVSSTTDELPLPGVTILVEELGTGVASDENGFYTLSLKKGVYTLTLSHLNHIEKKLKIDLQSDGSYDVQLEEKANLLEGVTVTSYKYDRVQSTKMGFERLTTKSIEEIPLVLGEKDILKVASLLAGVQSIGEGTAGFNVRGSPADQNLFYIDKVPIYNTSHLFGFFSAFNSQAISEFSISKSNIPAKFGGRLASIFDITALEGDKNKYKVRGGISPVTGNILFEGPVQKEKSSVMVALRSTYSNWILKRIKNDDFNRTRVNFADAIVKFSQQLSSKSRIQAFGYYSFDDIKFAGKTNFDNNNLGGSLSWNHFFNEKTNMNLAVITSRTQLGVEEVEIPFEAYKQNSELLHQEARTDWTWRINPRHQLEFGGNAILYTNDRGTFLPSDESSLIQPITFDVEKGLETGLYVNKEWKPSDLITVVGGLRYNQYNYLGPQKVFQYQDDFPISEETITDTLQFQKGDNIVTYNSIDYRLAVRYSLLSNLSIKASYNTLHQYLFLLSNTIALAPTDKWKLTDYNIEPMAGQQASFGVYGDLANKRYDWSTEFYIKKVSQLVEYRDGANLLINEFPERDILQGDLDAWGVELTFKKTAGRFNGWVNYTYSRSRVLVQGVDDASSINFGNSYPSNYDRPHVANVVANYKFKRRFSLSANMVYQSGRPITYPTNTYTQSGFQIINYSERNKYRVPDYFRIDVSAKFEGNLKKEKLLHGAWVFSIYNLLGRNNVYNEYFQFANNNVLGYRISIFARPIFSISYQFKFGNYDN
ncbi:MAG: TonB-dependent receptor [Chitinophagales bacterium]|nr:TonB-dependent receptor [Chitinophagales bacterium]